MTAALLWKEYREQRTSAIALLAFAVGLLVAIHMYAEPFPPLTSMQFAGQSMPSALFPPFALLSVCLVWMTGLIAGSQAFASEIENQTNFWLDSQPLWRRQIYRTKMVFAALFTLIQAAVLLALGLATHWIHLQTLTETVLFFLTAGFTGLGCGLLASTFTRSALAALGLALVVESLVGALWFLLAMLIPASNQSSYFLGIVLTGLGCGVLAAMLVRTALRGIGLVLTVGAFFVVLWVLILKGTRASAMRDIVESRFALSAVICILLPFVGAYRRFTRLDRQRMPVARWRRSRQEYNLRALIWLCWRQHRWVLIGVTIAGAIAASALSIAFDPNIWPPLGMAFGIVAGVGAFAADRPGDAFRFLGDRRLPPGRVWIVKALFCAVIAFIPVLLQLLGGYAFAKFEQYKNFSAGPMSSAFASGSEASNLVLGPLYGLAVGLLLGMLCRKGFVAAILAAMLGCMMLAVWWPSIVLQGLHVWQWAPPALALVAATWLAMRPWVAGRLASRRPIVGVACASIAAVALMCLGIWWRIGEVPQLNDPFNVAAFKASLPTPEQNVAGRKLASLLRTFPNPRDRAPDVLRPVDEVQWKRWWDMFSLVREATTKPSWPHEDEELNQWLDEYFANPWFAQFRDAVALPLGMIGPVSRENWVVGSNASIVGQLMTFRAVQLASRGQSADAFDECFSTLALSRQLRSYTTGEADSSGSSIEHVGILTLPRLIQLSSMQPDLIAGVLARLVEHDKTVPPFDETLRIDYLASEARASKQLTDAKPAADRSQEFHRIAMHVPWEQKRIDGIRASLFAGYFRTNKLPFADAMQRINSAKGDSDERFQPLYWWTPQSQDESAARAEYRTMSQLLRAYSPNTLAFQLFPAEIASRCRRRAVILVVALQLHELRHGKPAATLTDLVPECLQELPLDPYCDKLFVYRPSSREITAGEEVLWLRRPNQGIIGLGLTTWDPFKWRDGGIELSFRVPDVKKP